MDKTAGVYYLRANDGAYPAVSTTVKSAVDKCNAETDGSGYARALWLHDRTLDQLEYDRSLNWCSAESGLTRHKGTCESYQRIYAKLLNAASIAIPFEPIRIAYAWLSVFRLQFIILSPTPPETQIKH